MKHLVPGCAVAVVLALGIAACAGTPPSTPVSPSTAAGLVLAAAESASLKVTAPALIHPTDGRTIDTRRPTFVWANAVGTYDNIGLAYELEVTEQTGEVIYSRVVGESADFSTHQMDFDLAENKTYSWRVRAVLVTSQGPWSGTTDFRTPRPVIVVPTPVPGPDVVNAYRTPDPPPGQRLPRPNHLGVLLAMSAADPSLLRESCQEHGGNWRFMDKTVDTLRILDMRYGYNCKRGNCNDPSLDVIAYHWGPGPDEGSTQVYCTDIISGHCGPTPSIFWNDVTDITFSSGTVCKVMSCRPGRKCPLPPT